MKKGILLLGLAALLLCASCQEKEEHQTQPSIEMVQHTYRIMLDVPLDSKLNHWSSNYASVVKRGDDIYELLFSHYMWYPFANGPKFWEDKGIEKRYNGENGKSFDCKIFTEDEAKYISSSLYGFDFKGKYGDSDLILQTEEGKFEEIYTLHLTRLFISEYDGSLDDLYKEAISKP